MSYVTPRPASSFPPSYSSELQGKNKEIVDYAVKTLQRLVDRYCEGEGKDITTVSIDGSQLEGDLHCANTVASSLLVLEEYTMFVCPLKELLDIVHNLFRIIHSPLFSDTVPLALETKVPALQQTIPLLTHASSRTLNMS